MELEESGAVCEEDRAPTMNKPTLVFTAVLVQNGYSRVRDAESGRCGSGNGGSELGRVFWERETS